MIKMKQDKSNNAIKFQRKEVILNIRARLRQDRNLRDEIVGSILELMNLNGSSSNHLALLSHLTIALDEEINDEQAHVIV